MMTIREERGIRIGLDRVKKNNTELKNGMQSEDGYMPFFVFGKNRIRISEHFESSEKTLQEHAARSDEKQRKHNHSVEM